MVNRRCERSNPLMTQLGEYRRLSKPSFKLESEEIKRLAHMQAEAFVSHPDMQMKLKDIIETSDHQSD